MTAMTRSGDGWCTFARQIVLDKKCYGAEWTDKLGFCDHAAQGFYGTLISPSFWAQSGNSVQFATSRDGEIAQLINLFETCHGQGRDSRDMPVGPTSPGVTWPPFKALGSPNPNPILVGIENEDYTLINGRSTHVPGSQWTEAQYQANLRIKRWSMEEHKRVRGKSMLLYGIDSLASHHMFDPVNRAECAGRFWREEYQQRLYNDLILLETDDMFVRHNARSAWFDDAAHNVLQQGTAHCNATLDFGLPADVGEIMLEVETSGPAELLVLDGLNDVDLKGYAGKLESPSIGGISIAQVRVKLQKTNTGAWLSLRALGHVALRTVGCVGYFK